MHEVAHGWTALRLGDTTARDLGRLTFNPLPHIDLFGSILVPLFAFLAQLPLMLAWAKPVPINPANFRMPRRDDMLVAVMGPFSNFAIAFLCVFAYAAVAFLAPNVLTGEEGVTAGFFEFLRKMFAAGITINVFLGVFNLLPIPPLDGSHVLASLLPPAVGEKFRELGFLGLFLVIFLLNMPQVQEMLVVVVRWLSVPYIFLLRLFGTQ